MIDFSLTEKLNQLKDIFMSSSFFFISLILGIFLLVVIIIGIKKNRRINKIIFIVAWTFVVIFCLIRYFNFFISIIDRLFGRMVEEIYFPSLSVYTIMLVITNILFTYSLLKKSINSVIRIVNIATGMLQDLVLVLVLDVIMKNNIDIYSKLTYSNPKLLVLLEFSMFIFITWIFIISAIIIIKKYAVKEVVVSTYKEKDYEVVDILNSDKNLNNNEDDCLAEIIDLNSPATTSNDNTEIVEL